MRQNGVGVTSAKVRRPTLNLTVVVVTVGLLILTVAELYMIATVGPRAADKARKIEMKQQAQAESTEPSSGEAATPPPGKS